MISSVTCHYFSVNVCIRETEGRGQELSECERDQLARQGGRNVDQTRESRVVDGKGIFSILTFQVSFPGSVSRSDKYLPLKLNSNTLNDTERDGHEVEEVPQESPPQEEHVNDKKSL